ncbi:MAG: anthranilate synthase component I, partial [Cellulosilyticum sp.]|nr:anthranilate synthase component I [Cellulosilyticum sp.]
LEALKKLMASYKAPKLKELPPFTGGAVGYFGYDMVRYTEKIPMTNKDEIDVADIKLMFFNDIIAFDHLKQKIFLITNIDAKVEDLEEAYDEAKAHLKELMDFISRPIKRRVVQFEEDIHFESNMSKEAFIAKVEKAKAYIANGDIFQVVPSQIFKTELSSNLFDVYRVLRTMNPSPYMYLMQFDDLQLAGASPETLVKVQDGIVTTMPIAGTHPRGKTEEEDRRLDEELLNNPKELAEHNMLVDLARNDIGKISEIDTVEVTEYKALQRFSHVTHITSTVKGRLKSGLNSVDAIRSILPAGTLSGAPKVRAMEIIEELEEQRRGIYGGGIGYIGYDGSLDTCIAIRTIVKKEGMAYVQAGAGIVLDSNPELEYQECVNKASALFEAMKEVREIL